MPVGAGCWCGDGGCWGMRVWVEKIEKNSWRFDKLVNFLDVDNFQVLFGTFFSALGRSL